MAISFYNSFKKNVLDGTIDMANDTIKMMIVTSSYTPNVDSHNFIDDVSANEVAASGSYSAGGLTLASKTTTQDDTDNEGVFDCADPSATSATITGRYVVFYKDTGTPATSPLICYDDMTSNQTSTAGTWTYTIPAEGLINVN